MEENPINIMEDSESPEGKTTDSDISTDQFSDSSPQKPNINFSDSQIIDSNLDNKTCDKISPNETELIPVDIKVSPESEDGPEKTDNSKEKRSSGSAITDASGSNCDISSDRESIEGEASISDKSVDNNTFNIITENSESQEISDITNEDCSMPVGAAASDSTCEGSGIIVPAVNVQNCQGATQPIEFRGLVDEYDDEYCDEEIILEVGDDSDSYSGSGIFDPGAEPVLQSEYSDATPACEIIPHEMVESSTSLDDKELMSCSNSNSSANNQKDNDYESEHGQNKKSISKKQVPKRIASPSLRKRLGSFGKSFPKPCKDDFKIEIFESKKPTQFQQENQPLLDDDDADKSETKKDETLFISFAEVKPTQSSNMHIFIQNDLKKDKKSKSNSQICHSEKVSNHDVPNHRNSFSESISFDISSAINEEGDSSCNSHKSFLRFPSGRTRKKALRPRSIDGLECLSDTKKLNDSCSRLDSKSCTNIYSPTPSLTTPSGASGDVTDSDSKKPSPMAFTIDLGNGSNNEEGKDKKLEISASISKWAPKHRRNLSLTKVEEHKKVEERSGKPPVGRPRSGTIGSGMTGGRRIGGYHSEGYFSSDQDDEPRRNELKSPRSPRTPELKSPITPSVGTVNRSPSQSSLRMRPPSPDSSGASFTMTLNESASFLIEKMVNSTPEAKRKLSGARETGRTCCKGTEKKPSLAESSGRAPRTDRCSKSKSGCESRKSTTSIPDSQQLENQKDSTRIDDGDDVSEAGTYTIEKDSPSPEIDNARSEIDRVFGILTDNDQSDIQIGENTTVINGAIAKQDNENFSDQEKMKISSSLSRSSPNWIQQWAAQVAEQTKSPQSPTSPSVSLTKPSLANSSLASTLPSPRTSKAPSNIMTSSLESGDFRPRRKLPTPPALTQSGYSVTSPRASESDQESPSKGRFWRDMSLQDSLTSDTESFLRETQHLVTSLQARVDLNKSALRGSSFESHDSGGDSDIDTSTSYPINEEERLSAAIRSKLRLSGLDSPTKTGSVSATMSPRKPESKLPSHLIKRERSVLSDCGGYDAYAKRREDAGGSLQSDSSSESSEPLKDNRKPSDNNPPLKFNRAFSLRRARLGCDDTGGTAATPDKKKPVRPSSAGASTGSRKTPLSSTKVHQSADGGSPRGNSQNGQKGNGSNDFGRNDGGRFSLRVPRSGSTSAVIKSPSKTSVKKEVSGLVRRQPPRSNSSMSSKEIDFQNWKRRKNYDPMKAAAEGRKKVVDKKVEKSSPGHTINISDSSSPPGSLLRSASFHGTEGGMASSKWPRRNHQQAVYTSEEDGPYSLEEENHPTVPHTSPLRRSPTSPQQLSAGDGHSSHTPPASPARVNSINTQRARRGSYGHSEDGDLLVSSPSRKISLDESGSEGKKSPLSGAVSMGSRGSSSGARSKAKMEALDNLVISTIHSLSVKVRTTSETVLQKIKSQYDEEGDRAALLEEVLSHLTESDQLVGNSRSTSRELAGILRNLKKIEHALEVIDRVMLSGDEEELDEYDLLDTQTGQDWPDESDY